MAELVLDKPGHEGEVGVSHHREWDRKEIEYHG
jgi:hypothetical protein